MAGRRGEVFIAPVDSVPADGSMVDPANSKFWVSWQDEGEAGPLEDAEVVGAEAAISWGRKRSPIVWIRLGNRGDTYFSAGDEHPADDDPEEFVPHWPPDGSPSGGWWNVPPIPTLEEIQNMAGRVESGDASATEASRWAAERLSFALRAEGDLNQETLNALVALTGPDPASK
jgi:hypothetical protein